MVKCSGIINAQATVAKTVAFSVQEKYPVRTVKFTDPVTPCTNGNFQEHIM